jgi:hypothetical protein
MRNVHPTLPRCGTDFIATHLVVSEYSVWLRDDE